MMRSHDKHPIVAYLDENNTLAAALSERMPQAHIVKWAEASVQSSRFSARRKPGLEDEPTYVSLNGDQATKSRRKGRHEDLNAISPEDGTLEEPDVFLMDLSGSQRHYADVIAHCRQLIKDDVDLPMLLVIPPERRGEIDHEPLSTLLDRLESDCVFSPIQSEEVSFRLRKLWQSRLRQRQQEAAECLFSHFVPMMRGPKSGRLDAKRTSELFGLTLTEIAQILGRQLSTIAKTPDAEALQSGLRPLERIASALLFLTKTPQALRMWMNAENPEFQGKTPMALVKEGLSEVVAISLENAIMGQPD